MDRKPNRAAPLLAATLLSMSAAAAAAVPTLHWSDLHDGGAAQFDEGVRALFDHAGNPVVGGMRTPAGGRSDIVVRKLDRADGSPLWTHVYADPAGNDMMLADLVIDHRGDLLVAGYLSACDG